MICDVVMGGFCRKFTILWCDSSFISIRDDVHTKKNSSQQHDAERKLAGKKTLLKTGIKHRMEDKKG